MSLILLCLYLFVYRLFGVPPFMDFVRPPPGSTLLTRCDAGVVHVFDSKGFTHILHKKIIPKLKAGHGGF